MGGTCAASLLAGRVRYFKTSVELYPGAVRVDPTIRPNLVSLHRSMFGSFRCVLWDSQRGNSNIH